MQELFIFRHGSYDDRQLNNQGIEQANSAGDYIAKFLGERLWKFRLNKSEPNITNEGLLVINSGVFERTAGFTKIISQNLSKELRDIFYTRQRRILVEEPETFPWGENSQSAFSATQKVLDSFENLATIGIIVGHNPIPRMFTKNYLDQGFTYDGSFDLKSELKMGNGFHISKIERKVSFLDNSQRK